MRIKKVFAALLVICCLITSMGIINVNAEEMNVTVEIVSLEADEESYVLPSNGYRKNISIYGITSEGIKIKLEDGLSYLSENDQIVSIYHNTIRAEKAGSTNIFVKYNDLSLTIPVTINNNIDLDMLEKSLLEKAGCTPEVQANYEQVPEYSTSSKRTPQQILDKAAAMKNVVWTPVKDLAGWDGFPFTAGQTYEGIPYSQLEQVDEIKFLSKLENASDFYRKNSIKGKTDNCPTYGVDCSGYVSFAFGLDRMNTSTMVEHLENGTGDIVKVGDYNPKSLTKTSLYNAYRKLQPGNALVKTGHAVLVLSNDSYSEEIVVYETTNTKPIVSVYSYSILYNERYRPFQLK